MQTVLSRLCRAVRRGDNTVANDAADGGDNENNDDRETSPTTAAGRAFLRDRAAAGGNDANLNAGTAAKTRLVKRENTAMEMARTGGSHA